MERSFAKMAAVARMDGEGPYIQTGFAQRGLGIGWRLQTPDEVAEYYELMPVSLGVVLLQADVETVQRRNVERGKDRSFMVPLMQRPLEVAEVVLRRRKVPLLILDTGRPVEQTKEELWGFVARSLRSAVP